MGYFRTIFNIIEKDILLELKTKEVINSMLIFALLVVIVFSFIFEPGAEYKIDLAAGILWMAIIFSGILGLNKSMMNEVTGGNLSALLLAPIDRSAIFLVRHFQTLSSYCLWKSLQFLYIRFFMISLY